MDIIHIDNIADTVGDHQDDQQPLDIRVGGSIALKTGKIIVDIAGTMR